MVLQFFVLHSNYSALVHSKLQHNTVIVKSQGKAISIYYNCNSIHVYRYQLKWYSISFLRLQDWNWLICYKLFLSTPYFTVVLPLRFLREYLDVWLCTHGDDLVQFSVENHLADGSVVCVGHLHCVLHSPSQGPWVDHTGSYQEIKIVPECQCKCQYWWFKEVYNRKSIYLSKAFHALNQIPWNRFSFHQVAPRCL